MLPAVLNRLLLFLHLILYNLNFVDFLILQVEYTVLQQQDFQQDARHRKYKLSVTFRMLRQLLSNLHRELSSS